MIRLVLLLLLFLFSLLTVFRAPTNILWYVSILITEFCWLFFLMVLILLFINHPSKYSVFTSVVGIAALVLYSVPIVSAYRLNNKVKGVFDAKTVINKRSQPYQFFKMFTPFSAKETPYITYTYDTVKNLSLDFYRAQSTKQKSPCIVVVHGGSWAGGDSRQLPELNSVLAQEGYAVATINYRLAPQYTFPAPVEDVESALNYLSLHAQDLGIDIQPVCIIRTECGRTNCIVGCLPVKR